MGEQHKTAAFRFAGFYARRVRRILLRPTVVIVATWPPRGLGSRRSGCGHRLRRSVLGVFPVSITGWRSKGLTISPVPRPRLFSITGRWRLSEQFYLLWPLLLVVAIWLGRKWRRSDADCQRHATSPSSAVAVPVSHDYSVAQPWGVLRASHARVELAIGALGGGYGRRAL